MDAGFCAKVCFEEYFHDVLNRVSCRCCCWYETVALRHTFLLLAEHAVCCWCTLLVCNTHLSCLQDMLCCALLVCSVGVRYASLLLADYAALLCYDCALRVCWVERSSHCIRGADRPQQRRCLCAGRHPRPPPAMWIVWGARAGRPAPRRRGRYRRVSVT